MPCHPICTRSLMVIACLFVLPVSAADSFATRQTLFEERRAIESISHHERIRILQEAEKCIQAATNFREYRACEHEEKQAREALREKLRPRLQALRTKVQTFRENR